MPGWEDNSKFDPRSGGKVYEVRGNFNQGDVIGHIARDPENMHLWQVVEGKVETFGSSEFFHVYKVVDGGFSSGYNAINWLRDRK